MNRKTAYLVAQVILDPEGRFLPVVGRVNIFSSPAGSICCDLDRTTHLDITSAEGETFGEASSKLIEMVERSYPWAKRLMDPSVF